MIQAIELYKSFGRVRANINVSLEIKSGTIHAVLGENGAGKSTLMNQIYGLYRPDAGKILFKGHETHFRSPADAIASGMYMVSQNYNLLLPFTVRENIEVLPGVKKDLNRIRIRKGAKSEEASPHSIDDTVTNIGKNTGLVINLDAIVRDLSMGERQKIELVRALVTGSEVLILDEPTSNLTPIEADNLFIFLRKLAQQNYTVILVTHKIREVMNHCDNVTILRRGQVVSTNNVKDVTREQLAIDIVGNSILEPAARAGDSSNNNSINGSAGRVETLVIKDVVYKSDGRRKSLQNSSLEIAPGEVLGVAGVSGNGQVELGLIAAGKLKPTSGKIVISGTDVTHESIIDIIARGVAFIPDEGPAGGIVPDMTIAENLSLRNYRDNCSKYGFVDNASLDEHAERLIKEFDIRPPDKSLKARLLSGGNLQKLIIARELSGNPSVLVAMNPTRGLDILVTETVHTAILHLRDKGCAVLLVSEDLDELLKLSDRLAVMFESKIVGVWTKNEIFSTQKNVAEFLGAKMVGAN